jgi:hypothetical protein
MESVIITLLQIDNIVVSGEIQRLLEESQIYTLLRSGMYVLAWTRG